MVKVMAKYVHHFFDRHGNQRAYFRREGFPKWKLRTPLHSPEFWEDHQAAMRGETPPGVLMSGKPAPARKVKGGSLRWLCGEYKKSAAYKSLADNTKRVTNRTIERLCNVEIDSHKAGDLPAASMRRKHVINIRDTFADKPEAANGFVKLMRELFKVALDQEAVEADPTYRVALLRPNNPDGHHAWTLAEFEQYEAKHPVGTKARLMLALLLYTDQRLSDVAKLGRQHERKGRLEFTQTKNRGKKPVRLSIPIISELRAAIDAAPTGDMTYLVNEWGKSFSVKGLGNRFRKWCDEAGLHHCSAHGVRKGAAARWAELGCTNQMLKALGGWKTDKEVSRYTASAEQKTLADKAAELIEADIERTKLSNLSGDGRKV